MSVPDLDFDRRFRDIEMAFMLFAAMATGEPQDATEEEREADQLVFAEIIERIRKRNA